jgi:hypothetical protein
LESRERMNFARIIFHASSVLCILAVLGFLFLPEAWVAFLKYTIQNDLGPMREYYGCSPQEEPCCQLGYNRTAFMGEQAYGNVTCVYVPYPVKETMALLAAAYLAIAALARAWEKRAGGKNQLS